MQPFDDRSSAEMDPQNEDVITFLSQAHGLPTGVAPTPDEERLALARVRQRLQAYPHSTFVAEEAVTQKPALRLVASLHEPEEMLPSVHTQTMRQRGWQRRFSLLAASILVAVVVGSMLGVFGLLKSQTGIANAQAIYALSGGTLQKVNAQDGTLLWQYQVSTNTKAGFRALAAMNNGVVYVTEQQKLLALRASDGALLWSKNLDGVSGVQPVVVKSTLYLLIWKDVAKYDDHASLEAFNALSGDRLWHYDGPLFSSFAVVNDTVYGGLNLSPPPTNNNFHADFDLFALHAADGSEAWRVHLDDPSLSSSTGKITLVDGKVYITANTNGKSGTDFQSYLYAYSARSGAFLWRVGSLQSLLVWFGGSHIIYAQGAQAFSPGDLSAFDARDGHLLWTHPGGRFGGGGYVLENNRIFSGETHSDGYYIVELNAVTGKVVSQHQIGKLDPARGHSTPMVVNGQTIQQITAANQGPFAMSLISADSTYIITPDRHLEAFSNASGAQLWSMQLQGGSSTLPVILAQEV